MLRLGHGKDDLGPNRAFPQLGRLCTWRSWPISFHHPIECSIDVFFMSQSFIIWLSLWFSSFHYRLASIRNLLLVRGQLWICTAINSSVLIHTSHVINRAISLAISIHDFLTISFANINSPPLTSHQPQRNSIIHHLFNIINCPANARGKLYVNLTLIH
jgi:hypothetical protein